MKTSLVILFANVAYLLFTAGNVFDEFKKESDVINIATARIDTVPGQKYIPGKDSVFNNFNDSIVKKIQEAIDYRIPRVNSLTLTIF